jgi:hypothetical protein
VSTACAVPILRHGDDNSRAAYHAMRTPHATYT